MFYMFIFKIPMLFTFVADLAHCIWINIFAQHIPIVFADFSDTLYSSGHGDVMPCDTRFYFCFYPCLKKNSKSCQIDINQL